MEKGLLEEGWLGKTFWRERHLKEDGMKQGSQPCRCEVRAFQYKGPGAESKLEHSDAVLGITVQTEALMIGRDEIMWGS